MQPQIRKTISLTRRDEDFVTAQLAAGEFNNTSEVFRAGLRLLEQEQLKLAALRKAIDEGDADLAAGRVRSFAPGGIAALMMEHARKR